MSEWWANAGRNELSIICWRCLMEMPYFINVFTWYKCLHGKHLQKDKLFVFNKPPLGSLQLNKIFLGKSFN